MDERLQRISSPSGRATSPARSCRIALYYADDPHGAELAPAPPRASTAAWCCTWPRCATANRCASTPRARSAPAAKRYLGFTQRAAPELRVLPLLRHPGREWRASATRSRPELVTELLAKAPKFDAPARYAIFKRWDMLAADDEPQVVIFFATPDVLSGLFTLAGFDETETQAVIAPFAAGCGSHRAVPVTWS